MGVSPSGFGSRILVLLLATTLTVISSVDGLKCYWCYDDTGEADCAVIKIGEEEKCEPPYDKACVRDTWYAEDGRVGKKLRGRNCVQEDEPVGCRHATYLEQKFCRCVCKTDMCNGEASEADLKVQESELNMRHGDHSDVKLNASNKSNPGNRNALLILIVGLALTLTLTVTKFFNAHSRTSARSPSGVTK